MLFGDLLPKNIKTLLVACGIVILCVFSGSILSSCSQEKLVTNNTEAPMCTQVLNKPFIEKAGIATSAVIAVHHNNLIQHISRLKSTALQRIPTKKIHLLAIKTLHKTHPVQLAMSLIPIGNKSLKHVHEMKWWGRNGILSYILLIITLIIILSLVVYLLTNLGGITGFLAFAIGGGIGIAMIVVYMITHPVG